MQRDTIAALLKHYALGSEDENKDAYDMPPIVVDAGALDLLPERVPGQVVITPHAGEMARNCSTGSKPPPAPRSMPIRTSRTPPTTCG